MWQWLRSVGQGRPTRSGDSIPITNFLPASLRPPFPWLFLYEAVGIFAFGVSWFVEGQTLSEPEAELVREVGRDTTARSA